MSGRGRAPKTLGIVAWAADVLEEIHPASMRALSYRGFTEGFMPSMDVKYTQMMSRIITRAREEGEIPWEHIVDETREAERITTWNNPDEIVSAAIRGYRKDYWSTQPEWIEVWSEKGTVRGTLAPVLKKYGVTFRVMHGFGSATVMHDIAEESKYGDKRLTAFYIGDWDPSGLWMSERDIPDRMDRYDGYVDVERIALTAEDVARGTKLPSFKAATKVKDPRHKWFKDTYGSLCWELDAMSPVVLRKRVEEAIVSRLDIEAWNHAVKVEKAESDSMKEILTNWRSISAPVQKYSDGDGA